MLPIVTLNYAPYYGKFLHLIQNAETLTQEIDTLILCVVQKKFLHCYFIIVEQLLLALQKCLLKLTVVHIIEIFLQRVRIILLVFLMRSNLYVNFFSRTILWSLYLFLCVYHFSLILNFFYRDVTYFSSGKLWAIMFHGPCIWLMVHVR